MHKTKSSANEFRIFQSGQNIILGVSTIILSSIYLNPTPAFRARISNLWSMKTSDKQRASVVRFPDQTRKHTHRIGTSAISLFYSMKSTSKTMKDVIVETKNRMGPKRIKLPHQENGIAQTGSSTILRLRHAAKNLSRHEATEKNESTQPIDVVQTTVAERSNKDVTMKKKKTKTVTVRGKRDRSFTK